MTGGYFHKLLQFLQPSCLALASLATVNGACVAGCGPGEAAGFAGGWGGGVLGAGGRLVWECSCEPQPQDAGVAGMAAPWASGPCPGSAVGIDTFRAPFLRLFLFIAPLVWMAKGENFHSPLCSP